MFRLTLAGANTHITSSLCAACPHSPAGCCVAPPRFDWSDIARVVELGGRDWLIEEMANGNLVRGEFGIYLRRVKGRVTEERGAPRVVKCVFHGPAGCTISAVRRPATCNFYVCESAFEHALREDGGEGAVRTARAAHTAIVDDFIAWDEELRKRIRERWPEGPSFDAHFLDWLRQEFVAVRSTAR